MRPELEQHGVSVKLEQPIWRLLQKYKQAVHLKLVERKRPPATLSRLVGAILTDFFLAHRDEILEECHDAEVQELLRYLADRFEPGELAQLGFDTSTLATEVPIVHGAGPARGGDPSDATPKEGPL